MLQPAHQHCDLLRGQLLCVKHGCNELVKVDALRVAVNLHTAHKAQQQGATQHMVT
jgi:hypothetical protein